MIFVLDNYDSFTYNLVDYIGEIYPNITIIRNDKITVQEIEKLSPKAIVISPGPKTPKDAGISIELIQKLSGKIPMLGVCLGHQSIGEAFGGKVVQASSIMHGKTSLVRHNQKNIFKDIPSPFEATRYHSLVVESSSLPDSLQITAETQDKTIMGLEAKHKKHLYGVQFHPESILTNNGKKIIHNFVDIVL